MKKLLASLLSGALLLSLAACGGGTIPDLSGSASASMLISAHSCSAAMPTLSEVEEFIREEKEKYGEMVVLQESEEDRS